MTPSWYDLLDVEESATDAEVRAAWKAAIADLDPTDRRFRVYNEAAEVLLDPARRSSYDEELAAATAPPPEPALEAGAESETSAGDAVPPRSTRVVPAWLLAGLAVLTAGMLVLAGLLWRDPSADGVADAARAAQTAAERAVPPVLSYDAADLEGSRTAASSYLTASYGRERDELFAEVIEVNAPNTGTKVEASVVESSVHRASDEDRVQVFLFIDQATTNKEQTEPLVTRTWVTMTMEQVDGEWLVAAMRVV